MLYLALTNDDSFTRIGSTLSEHVAVGNANSTGLLLPREKVGGMTDKWATKNVGQTLWWHMSLLSFVRCRNGGSDRLSKVRVTSQ